MRVEVSTSLSGCGGGLRACGGGGVHQPLGRSAYKGHGPPNSVIPLSLTASPCRPWRRARLLVPCGCMVKPGVVRGGGGAESVDGQLFHYRHVHRQHEVCAPVCVWCSMEPGRVRSCEAGVRHGGYAVRYEAQGDMRWGTRHWGCEVGLEAPGMRGGVKDAWGMRSVRL